MPGTLNPSTRRRVMTRGRVPGSPFLPKRGFFFPLIFYAPSPRSREKSFLFFFFFSFHPLSFITCTVLPTLSLHIIVRSERDFRIIGVCGFRVFAKMARFSHSRPRVLNSWLRVLCVCVRLSVCLCKQCEY